MRPWPGVAVALLAACNAQPAFVRYQEELTLLHRIGAAFSRSVDAEKSAVLAVTDEESETFAAESRTAADEVDRGIHELARIIAVDGRPEELAKVAAVKAAWTDLQAIDARLLTLAVANTNLKAMRLSAGEAARMLDRLVVALGEMAASSSDPERIRELSAASVSVMRIQTLHAPHIAAADAADMDRLEQQMRDSSHNVARVLSKLQSGATRMPGSRLAEATAAWDDYQRASAEVVRLSRENTNVRSFDISIHEKRHAAERFRSAIAALVDEVESSLPATR